MSLVNVFQALLLIACLLLIANVFKRTVMGQLAIPASLIAGLFALLLGPQVAGDWLTFTVNDSRYGLTDAILEIWKSLPSYLIVVVFAGLFLGNHIPSLKESINTSMPNLAFGYTIAIGQYVVGMLVVLLILTPLFDLNAIAGALIAVGFQGGHGTVAGLQSTFNAFDFNQGMDLGLGIATIGLISAIVIGTIMSNRNSDNQQQANIKLCPDAPQKEIEDRPIGLQFAILGSVIALAWLALSGLRAAEAGLFPDAEIAILKYMPLFPVAMMVGLVVQVSLNKMQVGHWTSHYQINQLSNLSLDILIVAALGSLDLTVLAEHWIPILVLGGTGVIYSVAIYFALAPWYFNKQWRVRGLGELGQSMGTTAVGLLLLKQASAQPQKHIQPFSYKQPLYEPIVGGGIVTALAIPIIANFGAMSFTFIMALTLMLIIGGYYVYAKKSVSD